MDGFKKFLLRGNLVDMAVAFIMAASFATVVKTFTDVLLGFVSRVFGGSPNFDSVVIWKDSKGVGIPIGTASTVTVPWRCVIVRSLETVAPGTKRSTHSRKRSA